MKKSLLSLSLSVWVAGVIPITTFNAYAASEAECSIWLCLPTGFPSGCEQAKSAFKQRIKKLKSPCPAFPDVYSKMPPSGALKCPRMKGLQP